MKRSVLICLIAVLGVFTCCKKSVDGNGSSEATNDTTTINGFVKYTIFAGQQFCDKNPYQTVSYSEQKFIVKFDSSAIYKSMDISNQWDINKLYGFSDNNAEHHQFSARIGWRWKDNELHLFVYVYNNGVTIINQNKDLGKIEIGTENNCSIRVSDNVYIFTVNGHSESIPRASTTTRAEGYKLYPYFGGQELAPHDIHIWIKEII